MPTSYSGSAAGKAVTDPVTVSNPNDGELASASSNSSAPSTLADFVKFILDSAGFLAVARTWSALQTFTAGIASGADIDVEGKITIDNDYEYEAPKTKYIELVCGTMGTGPLAVNSQATPGTSTEPPGITKTAPASPTDVDIFGQFWLPQGATITGAEVMVVSDPGSVSVTLQAYSLTKAAGGFSAGTTFVNSAQPTTGSGTGDWLAYSVTTGLVPTDGLVHVRITASIGSGDDFSVYAVRLTYTLPAVKPAG